MKKKRPLTLPFWKMWAGAFVYSLPIQIIAANLRRHQAFV